MHISLAPADAQSGTGQVRVGPARSRQQAQCRRPLPAPRINSRPAPIAAPLPGLARPAPRAHQPAPDCGAPPPSSRSDPGWLGSSGHERQDAQCQGGGAQPHSGSGDELRSRWARLGACSAPGRSSRAAGQRIELRPHCQAPPAPSARCRPALALTGRSGSPCKADRPLIGPCFDPRCAAKGLYDVMKSNLGPKGTIKMLVGGAGGAWGVGRWRRRRPRAPGPGSAAGRCRQGARCCLCARRLLLSCGHGLLAARRHAVPSAAAAACAAWRCGTAASLTARLSHILALICKHCPADIKLTKDGNVLLREMQVGAGPPAAGSRQQQQQHRRLVPGTPACLDHDARMAGRQDACACRGRPRSCQAAPRAHKAAARPVPEPQSPTQPCTPLLTCTPSHPPPPDHQPYGRDDCAHSCGPGRGHRVRALPARNGGQAPAQPCRLRRARWSNGDSASRLRPAPRACTPPLHPCASPPPVLHPAATARPPWWF